MSQIQQKGVRNQLLSLLDKSDFQSVASNLEPVDLPNRFMLATAGEMIPYVYFPDCGIGSIVAKSPEGQQVEAGLFGRDGCTPATLVYGSDQSPYDIFMQLGGSGHRMERKAFQQAIDQLPEFRKLMMLYAQNLTTQTSFTALSNAVHQVDERLARWLLMCHDRVDGDEIAVTHEFLALMLAVRRPSVTTSLHVLEGNLFIRAERGYITIRDRAALEAFAADAYGRPEEEYRRLLGDMRK